MNLPYIESKEFTGIDYNLEAFTKAEYDNCTFINCNFSNLDLSNYQFVECSFIDCNLSLCILKNTGLKELHFEKCKMVGINFNEVDPFLLQLKFTNCQLNLASFYKLKLKNSVFKNCSLNETDFNETDLTNALFNNCDFKLAIFDKTILEKADLSSSFHYAIDPEKNNIKKAKFSKEGLAGLLEKHQLIIT
ncbi:uncharacterized protein YjbI with pentapeptide repeats [Lutibacter oceani]|uniref:Uncharacterized protein YjbI with pentapeptide repeats n=1 Tax=Lutibacter oceani TaxID=1853311 RepID=A0A3D9RJI8_9FLAO|nr:pentapeptide repeat-containing protein [Lutibacter oceani]REE79897.1 uncharacterized protein YjbI with pentapeptide repeats [Lutibacter oceani]